MVPLFAHTYVSLQAEYASHLTIFIFSQHKRILLSALIYQGLLLQD
jgi:hypothetical protein